MSEYRNNIENSILNKLKNMNHPITQKLKENIHLFSIKELEQISDFLYNWNKNSIYLLFSDKLNEYKKILDNIKILRSQNRISQIKIEEKLERELLQKEIESIEFNF